MMRYGRRTWGRLAAGLLGLLLLAAGADGWATERTVPATDDPLRSAQGDPFRLSQGQPFRSPALQPFHVPIPGGIGHQPCIRCHFEGMGTIVPQEMLPRKYSIQYAFSSYWASPHGRLRALGERNAPRCVDCHLAEEWADILPQEHPDSPVNPRNLARICAKCHGDAMLGARVMDGSMHLELNRRSLKPGAPLSARYGFVPGITKLNQTYYVGPVDVVAWVNLLFLVLTVGTLTSLAAFMLLDMVRKLLDRRDRTRRTDDETA